MNTKLSGGARVVIQCQHQAECPFTVIITKSRAKATMGMWQLSEVSVCSHSLHCPHTSAPRISSKALESILKPDMCSAVPLRIHAEKIQQTYGINVGLSTICKAVRCMDEGPMGLWLHSGKAMLMGDREKGEEYGAETVFPEAVKGACNLHVKKDVCCP